MVVAVGQHPPTFCVYWCLLLSCQLLSKFHISVISARASFLFTNFSKCLSKRHICRISRVARNDTHPHPVLEGFEHIDIYNCLLSCVDDAFLVFSYSEIYYVTI